MDAIETLLWGSFVVSEMAHDTLETNGRLAHSAYTEVSQHCKRSSVLSFTLLKATVILCVHVELD